MPMTLDELDERIRAAIDAVGEGTLQKAFRENIFVYGTTGGAFVGNAIASWRAAMVRKREARNAELAAEGLEGPLEDVELRKLNIYDPGPRTKAALDNQMMDLYYGQVGTSVHERRVPAIGAYVHKAMGFSGFYDQKVSGRDAYLATVGTHRNDKGDVVEGWMNWPRPVGGKPEYDGFLYPDPERPGKGLTATKEMSRIIRAGVMYFGGTLIFEGTNVTYESVFVDGAYVSDTSLEAECLFKYFTPGISKAPFGNGQIIFHWFGEEAIPSQAKFHSNWYFRTDGTGKPIFHKMANSRADRSQKTKAIYDNFSRV